MKHFLGRVRLSIHPVIWLFASKLALAGFVLAIGLSLHFPAWGYRAALSYWQSGFTDSSALALALLLLPYSICITFFGKAVYQFWREAARIPAAVGA